MAKPKIDTQGRKYIQFKTPNTSGMEPEQCRKKIAAVLKKQSVGFTGIDISKMFFQPNGDYKLYGQHPFNNGDERYYWTGVDTENWKGFSIKIVHQLNNKPQ